MRSRVRGCRRLEVTSFVRPDVIPQLADAAEVLGADRRARGRERERADPERARAGRARSRCVRSWIRGGPRRPAFDEINVFLSASETHNQKNVNRSIEESLAGLEVVLGRAREEGLRCEGVISTAFGCPYEGRVPPERVLEIAAHLRDAGAQEIGFGDTTGMANPAQVASCSRAGATGCRGVELTAHFHNTRGQGLANVLAALEAGIESFESSFGELGGCPVPAGATGNIATEDLVSMLHEMGIDDRHRPGRAAGVRAARPGDPRPAAGQPHAGGGAGGVGRAGRSRDAIGSQSPSGRCRRAVSLA